MAVNPCQIVSARGPLNAERARVCVSVCIQMCSNARALLRFIESDKFIKFRTISFYGHTVSQRSGDECSAEPAVYTSRSLPTFVCTAHTHSHTLSFIHINVI